MLLVPEDPAGETLRVPVHRVFDGDGFLTKIQIAHGVELKTAVRFGFIDAPELGQYGGQEAKEFLTSLISDRWLDLTILVKMNTGRSVDPYGRIVAVPYLRSEDAEAGPRRRSVFSMLWSSAPTFRNIELEMVLNGWAWVLDRYGPDERYFEALENARRHRRGIWRRDDNIHPWEFKRTQYSQRRNRQETSQLALSESETTRCPRDRCAGHLVQRSGRFGHFYGCSEFPRCRYSCSQI